ncbi:hypothetical protein GCM10027160_33050 [Streptomyces calidiresistens]|uniref:Uncharacterized protein n=1 Tax=Streptomyces calidiresistens TaxID=1485586 RepID=A0A7W3XXU5_9ACTN|nr:hypothetical protein [Streptomyces calidiresistens]MBB0231324.1 hypothetical protein [Streptomyces calidiresistens]
MGPAVAVALLLACAACTGGENAGAEERSEPLEDLPAVEVLGAGSAAVEEVLAESGGRVLATARVGEEMFVFLTGGGSCGFAVVPDAAPSEARLTLFSAPALGGDEEERYPEGPYSFVSSGGGEAEEDRWTALLCGENAMVVEHVAELRDGGITDPTGEVGFVSGLPGNTTVFAVAEESRREAILGSTGSGT